MFDAQPRPSLLPRDTSVDAARVYYAAFRRMSPSDRVDRAVQMMRGAQEVTACGVRQRHPDYSEDQVRLAVIRMTLGRDLFKQAYPGQDVRP